MSTTRPDEYRIDALTALRIAEDVSNQLGATSATDKDVVAALRDERRYQLTRAKVLTDLYAASDVRAQFDSAEPEVAVTEDDTSHNPWYLRHDADLSAIDQPEVNGQPMPQDFQKCPACGGTQLLRLVDDWQDRVRHGFAIPIVGCGNPWHYATRSMGDPPDEDAKQPGISLPTEVQAQLDFLQESIAAIERYRRTLTLAAVEQAC